MTCGAATGHLFVRRVNYELELPDTLKVHPVFHELYLYPHQEDLIEGRTQPPPPPIEYDEGEEYEVEKILDGRLWRNQRQYLIKWEGYTDADNSWEPEKNLERAQEIIKDFHDKHPNFEWKKRRPRKSLAKALKEGVMS
jgi:hypothetical protein